VKQSAPALPRSTTSRAEPAVVGSARSGRAVGTPAQGRRPSVGPPPREHGAGAGGRSRRPDLRAAHAVFGPRPPSLHYSRRASARGRPRHARLNRPGPKRLSRRLAKNINNTRSFVTSSPCCCRSSGTCNKRRCAP
jgi:hypothetical protein